MISFQEYLEARRSVDDRAMNDRVFRAFTDGLADLAKRRAEPLRIVEVGGGIGSMIARLVERDALSGAVEYRLVDLDADCIDRARERLPARLADAGCAVERTPTGLVARSEALRDRESPDDAGNALEFEVILETGDAFADRDGATADAVIGSAVFDIVDRERALSWASSVLAPGGLVYAPLTYDGATGFAPSDPFDDRLERLYHRHMDEVRDEPGGSRAGRRLVGAFEGGDRPFEVAAVGGSDWVLRPRDRTTGAATDARTAATDARIVLRYLLETIDGALADYSAATLDPETRRRWVDRRRDELDRGALTAFAHHLDVLARRKR